jgi:hypothetical protein
MTPIVPPMATIQEVFRSTRPENALGGGRFRSGGPHGFGSEDGRGTLLVVCPCVQCGWYQSISSGQSKWS